MSSPATPESGRPAWWLAGLFLAMLAIGTDEFVIAGVLPEISADLAVSAAATGQLITVFAVVFALGAPLLALVTDRLPRRALIVVALVVFAVANAAAALAPGYWPLLGARVLAALAAALIASASFAMAAGAAPAGKQDRYLSVVTAGLTVALFTGRPARHLAGRDLRLAGHLLAPGRRRRNRGPGPGLDRPPTRRLAPLADRLAPLRRGSVARMVATIFLCGSGGLMFYSYLGPITAELAGAGYQLRSFILLLVGIVGVGAVFLGGRITDAWGPRPARLVVIGGHSVALLGLAAFALTGSRSIVAFAVLVALWSLFAWALNPPMQASMLAAAPDAAMTAVALNISGLYLGTAVAAALGGVVLSVSNAATIPLVAGLLLLAALALAWPPTTDPEQTPQPPTASRP